MARESMRGAAEGEPRLRRALDHIDTKIIAALRADGRKPHVALAEEIGVSEGTIRKRLQRLIRNGYMQIVAVTNPVRLGFQVDVAITIQADIARVLEVAQRLSEMEEVRYVGITTGPFDILCTASFRSTDELFSFLTDKVAAVPGLIKTETSHVLRTLKRTYDRPMPESAGLPQPPRPGERARRDKPAGGRGASRLSAGATGP